MKKMYNNPETEVMDLKGEMPMCIEGVTQGPDAPDQAEGAAPMRHVGFLGPSY